MSVKNVLNCNNEKNIVFVDKNDTLLLLSLYYTYIHTGPVTTHKLGESHALLIIFFIILIFFKYFSLTNNTEQAKEYLLVWV